MQFVGGIARASPAAPLLLQSDYWLVFSDRLEMIAKSKVIGLSQRQHRSSLCCRDTVWGYNMHYSSAQTCHSIVSAPVRCFKLSRRRKNNARLLSAWCSSSERKPIYTASSSSSSVSNESVGEESECLTLDEIKTTLCLALEGINRGIFGVPSAKKLEIEGLVNLLESRNPTLNPTQNLEKVAGCWKLIYSTITILGSKRTKLGLRDFIALGDFLQIIDIAKGKAATVIKFNVRGLNILNGQLLIEASFKIASNTRVDISYSDSSITPQQLMNLFRLNYKLLLGIFNPEGWLETTYVDDTLRIGRDDKGNIFILERSEDDVTR